MLGVLPGRVHLPEELRARLSGAEHLHAREPAQQVQPRRPGGVRVAGAVPALGSVRGQLPGGAPAPAGGEQQLPDRCEPGPPRPRGQRPVPLQAAEPGRSGAQRAGARGRQGARAQLAQLRELCRLVPLWQARVQDRRRAAHRQAALPLADSAVRPAQPHAGVPEPGGPDHGEAAQRPDRARRRAAGARYAPASGRARGGRQRCSADYAASQEPSGAWLRGEGGGGGGGRCGCGGALKASELGAELELQQPLSPSSSPSCLLGKWRVGEIRLRLWPGEEEGGREQE